MKKTLVMLLGGAGLLALIALIAMAPKKPDLAFAQSSGALNGAGGIQSMGITGVSAGGVSFSGQAYGPGGPGFSSPQPLNGGTYSIDGGSQGSFSLTQTVQGSSQNPVTAYQYTFAATDNTSLSTGSHTLTVCVGSGMCDTESFSVGSPKTSNNIPTTFNVSQTVTTGSDGNPLEITVQNIGSPWTSDKSAVTSAVPSGCNFISNNYACPSGAPTAPSSCTLTLNNSSDVYVLKHTSNSFTVGNDPVQFNQVTQNTCGEGAPSCMDARPGSGSSCNSSQSNCEEACIPSSNYAACTAGTENNPQECMNITDCENNACAGTWSSSYVTSINGSPDIDTNGNAVFSLGSLTAPATPGTYTETWQIMAGGIPVGPAISVPILVVASAPTSTSNGTITVTSENAQNPSVLVNAEWDLTGNVTNTIDGIVCSAASSIGTNGNILWPVENTPCSGEQRTYSNLPINVVGSNYILPDATTTVPGYSLRSIERIPIAENKNTSILESLQLSLKNVFSTIASAQVITIPGQTSTVNSQTLFPSLPSAAFVILWTPGADMLVSPSFITLNSSSSPSQTVTVTNDGERGSTLTWTAKANTTSGGNWLIAPSGDTNPGIASGGNDNATVSLSPSVVDVLPNGTSATGTITFNGYDTSSAVYPAPIVTKTVNVTLNVTNNQSSTQPITGVNCSSTTITVNGTTSCGPVGSGPYQCTVSGGGTVNSNCNYTAPNAPGTSTITICSTQPGYTNDCDSQTITVTPPAPPACQSASCQVSCGPLTATPSQIVIPESTKLQDSCSNVTNCQLTGGSFNQNYSTTPSGAQGTITVNASTSPSVSTTYTLTCINSNYNISDSQVSNVQVTVGGSSVCEQNPNGAGCPGQ